MSRKDENGMKYDPISKADREWFAAKIRELERRAEEASSNMDASPSTSLREMSASLAKREGMISVLARLGWKYHKGDIVRRMQGKYIED